MTILLMIFNKRSKCCSSAFDGIMSRSSQGSTELRRERWQSQQEEMAIAARGDCNRSSKRLHVPHGASDFSGVHKPVITCREADYDGSSLKFRRVGNKKVAFPFAIRLLICNFAPK